METLAAMYDDPALNEELKAPCKIQLDENSPKVHTFAACNRILPMTAEDGAQSTHPLYSEPLTENESLSSVESTSNLAHEKFCQLLNRLRTNFEGLFKILNGMGCSENIVAHSQSSVAERASSEMPGLEQNTRMCPSDVRANGNACSSKILQAHNDGKFEGTQCSTGDNSGIWNIAQIINSATGIAHSYFATYGILEGCSCPLYPLRPIVIDGDSCNGSMEILSCIYFFLNQHHCVVLFLSAKSFANFCKCSSQLSECLQWLRHAGVLTVIPAEPVKAEVANLNTESAYVEDLLQLAYLTGSAILSNRNLVSSLSNLAEWKRLAMFHLLRFSVVNDRTVKLEPAGRRHGYTSLEWLLQFPHKSHVDFVVRPLPKRESDELISRLDGFLSSLDDLPLSVEPTLTYA
uniref:RNase_Zc3h12a domain-containing protein n=1 Tax=Trichuris muris TaxID=70415 RepID=A0A5S6Q0M5_TRIMR